MASRLITAGFEVETIQTLLGYAELDHAKVYLQADRKVLRHMWQK